MILGGINFGPVWGMSGVQGFFGEGYPYHKIYKRLFPFGFSFSGMTFVSKTTTLNPKQGNMPLKKDGITPRDWRPKCIVVKPLKGVTLNAVGLSGPGAKALLETGRWQKRSGNFIISFMAIAPERSERLAELLDFCALLKRHLREFRGNIAIQQNFSCPNVGVHHDHLAGEIIESAATVARELAVPFIPKINVLFPVELAVDICSMLYFECICLSNTLPWGTLSDKVDWKGLFGSDKSPLLQFGGGGLSGPPLQLPVQKWVEKAREKKIEAYINAGGGIFNSNDIFRLMKVETRRAESVSLGTVAMLRPWRVQGLIRTAHKYAPRRQPGQLNLFKYNNPLTGSILR